jgi:hypothetical protein
VRQLRQSLFGFKGHVFATVRQLRQSLLGLATVTVANGPGHLIVAAYELASKRISMLWMLSAFQILKLRVLPPL